MLLICPISHHDKFDTATAIFMVLNEIYFPQLYEAR